MRGYFSTGLFCLLIAVCLATKCYAVQDNKTSDQKEQATQSIETLRTLAEFGEGNAQFKLGNAYHQGIGIGKDETQAIFWWQKAAGLGYSATVSGNSLAIHEVSDASRIASLKQAADRGDAWAQLELGVNYHKGWGVEQDDKQALILIHKSADQGNAKAQLELARIYVFGEDYRNIQNAKEGAKWCRKAADQGDAEAQLQLGWYYSLGAGVERNNKEAFKWIRKAAEKGDVVGENALAGCYQTGLGVERDDKQALKLYQKLATRDDPLAKFFLNNYNQCGDWRCYSHAKIKKNTPENDQ